MANYCRAVIKTLRGTLMMEGYFARSHHTGSGMALHTSCSGVLAASESAAVLLQETFLTSPVGTAGAITAVAVDLGEGSFLPLASVLPRRRRTVM
jgi:hypothetical protein